MSSLPALWPNKRAVWELLKGKALAALRLLCREADGDAVEGAVASVSALPASARVGGGALGVAAGPAAPSRPGV